MLTNTPGAIAVVSAQGGTPQSAIVGQSFAAPLTVLVTDADGNAIAGATVTFSAPATGASATLAPTTGVTTDANGNASVAATANAMAGSYTVTAAVQGSALTATFALTNTIDIASDTIFSDGFELPTKR